MSTPSSASVTEPLPQAPDSPLARTERGLVAPNPPRWVTSRHPTTLVDGKVKVPPRYLDLRRPPYPMYEQLEDGERIAVTRSVLRQLILPEVLLLVVFMLYAQIFWNRVNWQLNTLMLLVIAVLVIQTYLSWWAHVYYFTLTDITPYSGWFTPDSGDTITGNTINSPDVRLLRPKWLFGERGFNVAVIVLERGANPNISLGPLNSYNRVIDLVVGVQRSAGAGPRRAQQEARESLRTQQMLLNVTVAGMLASKQLTPAGALLLLQGDKERVRRICEALLASSSAATTPPTHQLSVNDAVVVRSDGNQDQRPEARHRPISDGSSPPDSKDN